MSRIVAPVLIGLLVVAYMMWKQLDVDQFKEIPWTTLTIFWIGMSIFLYVLRHMFYAWRLKILTGDAFTWSKCVELIFIWEFSSAVSPSSIGGSAVALFLLAQEKIGAAKTVSVILYTMVLDTLFFLISIPILVFTIGPHVIRPDLLAFDLSEKFTFSLLIIYIFIFSYGTLFFYGLFFSPNKIRDLLVWFSKRKFLVRWKDNLTQIGDDVVKTAKEVSEENLMFHIKSFVATIGAWITRFLAINCLIIALIPDTPLDSFTQYLLYGRAEIMHSITQFSPTPGGAGVMEYLFGGFFTDYIPKGIAFLVALLWRIITYYPYLIIGVIIIPNWIRKVMNRRRIEKLEMS